MSAIHGAAIPDLTLKEGTDRSKIDAVSVARKWLSDVEEGLRENTSSVAKQLFLDDSWWRDVLALSWKPQTSHGHDQIATFFQRARKVELADLEPVIHGALVPQLNDMGPFTLVETAFTFTTKFGSGKGYVRLANASSSESDWKAWIMMTNLQEIRGHEELHKKSLGPLWPELADHENYDRMSHTSPRVVIVGCGHSGLALAARLKQLGISALMVDKQSRLGDSWRKRYKNLSLHDPKHENHMPYLKFPETFPMWIPRQQIADWLESYQTILRLPVMLDCKITSAQWDQSKQTWEVQIMSERDSTETSLRPGHVVFASGFHSDVGNIPAFEGLTDFKGPILHSTKFTTVSHIPDYENKKFIVIGSSASAHDIAQDIAEAGCDVTMVQRDANCVYSLNARVNISGASYVKPGISTEDGDLLSSSIPFPVAISLMVGGTQAMYQMDRQLLDAVGKTEFKFLKGDDGRGLLHIILAKGGGHYPDQGSLGLIVDGTIKVRQCYGGIQRLVPDGVVLADDRKVEGDAIIMATGYKFVTTTMESILGEDFVSRCDPTFVMREDGEFSLYSALHPGLWWMAGSFALNRPGSRNLALQILATELGLNPDHYAPRI